MPHWYQHDKERIRKSYFADVGFEFCQGKMNGATDDAKLPGRALVLVIVDYLV